MQNQQNQRFVEIIIGIILVLAGFSTLGSAPTMFSLMLLVIGFMLTARNFNQTSTSGMTRTRPQPRWDYEDEEEYVPAQPRADNVYQHALDSVRRVGLNPNDLHVLPVDIGVMAFSGDNEPVIHRTIPVLDDVDYIQPFVQLRLPTTAVGRIRFELVDGDGEVRFIHENNHNLQRGMNLITPAARLPIHDALALDNDWLLRVFADGVQIAEHRFHWQESTSKVIRRHLKADGELTSEVRAMMAENRLQEMSLDELLEAQQMDEESRRAARR